MPQANRMVKFEPEYNDNEKIELIPRGKQRSPFIPLNLNKKLLLNLLSLMLFFPLFFAISMKYVGVEAKIADYEFQRQQLTAALTQSKQDCAQLEVDIAKLDNATRFEKIASEHSLYYPSPNEITYIKDAQDFPRIATNSIAADDTNPNWAVAASKKVASGFGTIYYRLNHARNPAAFAQ